MDLQIREYCVSFSKIFYSPRDIILRKRLYIWIHDEYERLCSHINTVSRRITWIVHIAHWNTKCHKIILWLPRQILRQGEPSLLRFFVRNKPKIWMIFSLLALHLSSSAQRKLPRCNNVMRYIPVYKLIRKNENTLMTIYERSFLPLILYSYFDCKHIPESLTDSVGEGEYLSQI